MKDLWQAFKELHQHIQIAITISILIRSVIVAFNRVALDSIQSMFFLILAFRK